MTLQECAERYACDKLHNHSYIPWYEEIFRGWKPEKLLEIGIGFEDLMRPFVPKYVHGASLRMWKDFFPQAQIFGCDNRQDTLFQAERIATVVCDQSQPLSLLGLISLTGRLDVIIDDGSHLFEHQMISAVTLWPYLRKGGVYVIEDTYQDWGDKLRWEAFGGGGRLYVGKKRPDDCMVVIRK